MVPALGDSVQFAHCSDIHNDLIVMYEALQNGWDPPENLSKEEYDQLRKLEGYGPLKAFAAFGCSFGGKEWGGYARDVRKTTSFAYTARNGLLKKKPFMKNVEFARHDYRDYAPKNCVIYCDPPYQGTTTYKTDKFDHQTFFDWCKQASNTNDVFVSEFNAPLGWQVVWEFERRIQVEATTGNVKVDRLYKVQ